LYGVGSINARGVAEFNSARHTIRVAQRLPAESSPCLSTCGL
jgi:hypothetical protein